MRNTWDYKQTGEVRLCPVANTSASSVGNAQAEDLQTPPALRINEPAPKLVLFRLIYQPRPNWGGTGCQAEV